MLEQVPQPRPRMTLRLRLLICLLFFGPAVYFMLESDYISATICCMTGIGAFSGYRVGAVYIFTLLAAVAAAVALAPSLGVSQETRFAEWFGTTGLTNRCLAISIIGLTMVFGISLAAIFIARKFMKGRPRMEAADRWIGLAVGSLEGVAAIVLFLGGLLVLEPIERERADERDPDDTRGRLVSTFILGTSERTRESRVGPALAAYNPMVVIPQLNKVEEVQRSAQVLSDPKKIQGLLQHPSIRQLQQRPEVRRAIDQLTADPAIQQIFRSDQPMDRSMVMTLMNHPAVLELIDQPDFVEEASNVILHTGMLAP